MKTNLKYKNSVFSRVYEKSIANKNIYSTKKLSIPQPAFFVLYNGTAPYPDKATLKLSDLFMSTEPLGIEQGKPVLELEVTVLNINEGKNESIIQNCGLLAQYSTFIAKVRECLKDGSILQEAIKKAVIYCREHDILKEPLEKQASEVLNMLMTEWNLDDAKEVWFDEGREKEREEIARNAFAEGIPINKIHNITGLDLETLKNIQERQN